MKRTSRVATVVLSILLGGGLFLYSGTHQNLHAQETTVTLTGPDVTDDAYISFPSVDANSGSDGLVIVHYDFEAFGGDPLVQSQGLLKFNLSVIPSGVTITSAVLEINTVSFLNVSNAVNVYRLTSDWDENTVTWGNQPSKGELAASMDKLPAGIRQLELTDLVSKWYQGIYPNYGVLFGLQTVQHDYFAFDSSDCGMPGPFFLFGQQIDPCLPPKLIVRYTVPVPTIQDCKNKVLQGVQQALITPEAEQPLMAILDAIDTKLKAGATSVALNQLIAFENRVQAIHAIDSSFSDQLLECSRAAFAAFLEEGKEVCVNVVVLKDVPNKNGGSKLEDFDEEKRKTTVENLVKGASDIFSQKLKFTLTFDKGRDISTTALDIFDAKGLVDTVDNQNFMGSLKKLSDSGFLKADCLNYVFVRGMKALDPTGKEADPQAVRGVTFFDSKNNVYNVSLISDFAVNAVGAPALKAQAFTVMAHEAGHQFGLPHSDTPQDNDLLAKLLNQVELTDDEKQQLTKSSRNLMFSQPIIPIFPPLLQGNELTAEQMKVILEKVDDPKKFKLHTLKGK